MNIMELILIIAIPLILFMAGMIGSVKSITQSLDPIESILNKIGPHDIGLLHKMLNDAFDAGDVQLFAVINEMIKEQNQKERK